MTGPADPGQGLPSPVPAGLERRLRDWAAGPARRLAPPGGGATWARFEALAEAAAEDLALGRLAEGHADALAILAEADLPPLSAGLYGVWAARGPGDRLTATRTGSGWVLHGRKGFCSGAGMLDRALVVAEAADGTRLFDLDARSGGVTTVADSWPAVGMAASDSSAVEFDTVMAGASQSVGPPSFYTSRIGFWWGAAGVAACWWGGARSLLETVGRHLGTGTAGDHELAAYGTAVARWRSMTETLRWAAAEIDGGADVDAARTIALTTREVVHAGSTAILASAAAAGGARPICLDPAQSRRSADLYAYLAQHHGGRDAAALGRAALAALSPDD